MTTQQLIWIAFGELGVIAFMVFMYGLARAKMYSAENERLIIEARLVSENIILRREIEHRKSDNEQLSQIIKELKADLSTEGDLRRETSRQLEETAKELIEAKKLIPVRKHPKRIRHRWVYSSKDVQVCNGCGHHRDQMTGLYFNGIQWVSKPTKCVKK